MPTWAQLVVLVIVLVLYLSGMVLGCIGAWKGFRTHDSDALLWLLGGVIACCVGSFVAAVMGVLTGAG